MPGRALRAFAVVMGLACVCQAQTPPTITQERKAHIEARLSNWGQLKPLMKGMTEAFLAQVYRRPKDYDYDSFRKGLDDAWKNAEGIEADEMRRGERILAWLEAEQNTGRLKPEEKTRRAAAAERIRQLRMAYSYGSLIPRALDEAIVENGRSAGRRLVGPSWGLTMTEPEFIALHDQYQADSQLPPKLLEGF